MQASPIRSRDDDSIDASVTIRAPVEQVFRFYQDFENLPRFLGDVIAIESIDPKTSRWTIQGPLGIRAHWTITVTEERRNELICYETVTSARLKTYWEIHFASSSVPGETVVREVMNPPLGRLGRAALALIGKFPVEEVRSNLRRLKELIETGTVTDIGYSVRGKFSNNLK